MVRLARQLPWAHAMKILLGGEPVSANEALSMGLISEVLAASELQERASHYADNICRQSPLALAAIKRTALDTHTLPWADAFAFEMEQAGNVMMSQDAREGRLARGETRVIGCGKLVQVRDHRRELRLQLAKPIFARMSNEFTDLCLSGANQNSLPTRRE